MGAKNFIFYNLVFKNKEKYGGFSGKLKCLIIKYMNAYMSFYDWCISNNKKELIDEFDLEMNAPLTTKDIYPKSNKKYYWKCQNGHSFLDSPFHRIMGYECNICKPHVVKKCNHGKITTKENGLAARRPDLLKYWDYEKNVGVDPTYVSCDSRQEYYWKCPNGHSYKTSTHVKFAMSGCPICLNKKVVAGLNDLATTHKELLKEWDYEKNIDISPTEVVAGSSKKVWWKCKDGHSWQAEIRKRAIFHQGCQICAAKNRHRKLKQIKTLGWWALLAFGKYFALTLLYIYIYIMVKTYKFAKQDYRSNVQMFLGQDAILALCRLTFLLKEKRHGY